MLSCKTEFELSYYTVIFQCYCLVCAYALGIFHLLCVLFILSYEIL